MHNVALLVTPRLKSFYNRVKKGEEGSTTRVLLLILVALAFWVGIFIGFYKVLAYFQAAEGFGNVLAHKLMGMAWLTFLAILIFSNIITTLSTFFLSKDLETIHASPIPLEHIFWARLVDTLVDSSWMIVFFGMPVFIAYGIVYDAGPLYYLKLAGLTPPFLVTATAIGVIFTIMLVNVFPAQRTKDILLLLTILVVIVLFLLFRFIQPERLMNPDAFNSVVSYFAAVGTPSSPYLPSHWAAEILWPSLSANSYSEAGFHMLLIWSTAGGLAVTASWVAALLYREGFSKSREGARRLVNRLNPVELLIYATTRPFKSQSRVLIAKDIRTFFRDNTQWSQLLLLLALIVIYLYNFSVLNLKQAPINIFWLQNTISFLNIGLASFVIASLAVRFVFPAVSQEGFSYWIIRTSPLTLTRFLWTKFFIYAPPLLVVSEVLIILSNYLLNVTQFMMILSSITIFFLVLGLVGLGVGLGAVYPRFSTENIAQVATGFGGLIYMILSAIYVAVVVVLEAWPVYMIMWSQVSGRPLKTGTAVLIGLCFLGVIVANLLAVFLPMRIGLRHLLAREAD